MSDNIIINLITCISSVLIALISLYGTLAVAKQLTAKQVLGLWLSVAVIVGLLLGLILTTLFYQRQLAPITAYIEAQQASALTPQPTAPVSPSDAPLPTPTVSLATSTETTTAIPLPDTAAHDAVLDPEQTETAPEELSTAIAEPVELQRPPVTAGTWSLKDGGGLLDNRILLLIPLAAVLGTLTGMIIVFRTRRNKV
ncbi:MAG TPA: hypothetical protein VGD69_30535 [Herpetosiphonaceae bacterium]